MAAYYNTNESMGVNDNYAKDALKLIKDTYRRIDMTKHEEKAMLCLLSSVFIKKPLGQEEMIRYHTDRRDFLSDAKHEIEEAIEDRQKIVNNTKRSFGYIGGRRRTLRKRTHRSKTRRNRK